MNDPITIRRAGDRGHARHGWLESRHTFSFGGYFDPQHMGFGALRVINEDRVVPGAGFGRHPHRDMEIISYVVSGGLAHRDTLGTGSTIRPDEVQLMSAGTGIEHSEMNASKTEPVHFLQMWVVPREPGGAPSYAQRDFGADTGVQLLVSADGRDDSLVIKQDVDLHRVRLRPGGSTELTLRYGAAWMQVVTGDARVGDHALSAGDGFAITRARALQIETQAGLEALVYDLPERH